MSSTRGPAAILALVAVLAVAVPAIAADPSPVALPGQGQGQGNGQGQGQGRGNGNADKGPEAPLTLSGVLEQTTDAKGRPTYTLTANGVTWELSAGPKWFHGAHSPLAAWVGQTVEVAGTHHPDADSGELDVETVNGAAIREAGKPSWAGGPNVVGESHPGWKSWKADGPGKPDGPPGQLKDKDPNDGG